MPDLSHLVGSEYRIRLEEYRTRLKVTTDLVGNRVSHLVGRSIASSWMKHRTQLEKKRTYPLMFQTYPGYHVFPRLFTALFTYSNLISTPTTPKTGDKS